MLLIFNIILLQLNICLCVLLEVLMYEHILYLFVVSALVSLYSQASFVQTLNELHFPKWCEQVKFHLSILDL